MLLNIYFIFCDYDWNSLTRSVLRGNYSKFTPTFMNVS